MDVDRRQRRRLRIDDEGVRGAAQGRPGVGRARARVCVEGARCHGDARGARAAARARHPIDLRVAYHDACHLAHAQGVRQPPRDAARVDPRRDDRADSPRARSAAAAPASSTWCSRRWPRELGRPQGGAHRRRRRPDVVATSNPGCILQIQRRGRARVGPATIRRWCTSFELVGRIRSATRSSRPKP